jgi:4-amino-4-deoxy-L-arabinose transferase-like glycosyltransferase
MWARYRDLISLFAFVFFSLGLGFATIAEYGPMNDAPIKFASGFRNYYFLISGDKAFLDPQDTPKLAKKLGLLHTHQFLEKDNFAPVDYSPLVDALSAATCNLFFQKLGWLNYFDAHNAIIIILFAVSVGMIYLFAKSLYGFWVGIISALFYGLFPRLIAHSHNNLSDIPLVFFFSITIMVFYQAVIRQNQKLLIVAIGLFGVSVATKLNSVFLIFILLPWYFAFKILNRQPLSKQEKSVWFFSPLIAYFSWLSVFPYFWTAENLGDFFSRQIHSHIFTMIFKENIVGYEGGWNLSVFQQAFATTPTVILIFLPIGLYFSFQKFLKERDTRFILFLLWIIVPLFKSSLPGIKNYEMIRHFMNYIPPLVILAGFGGVKSFQYINSFFESSFAKKSFATFGIFLITFSLTYPIYKIHPYEILFFNKATGGLKGGKIKFMYAYDYWQSSLRELILWVNKNAVANSNITLLHYFDYNIMEPSLLRKDLKKVNLEPIQEPITLNIQNQPTFHGMIEKYNFRGYVLALEKRINIGEFINLLEFDKNLKPIYSINIDNAPVAKIYHINYSYGIVRDSEKSYYLFFNEDGSLRRAITVEKSKAFLDY